VNQTDIDALRQTIDLRMKDLDEYGNNDGVEKCDECRRVTGHAPDCRTADMLAVIDFAEACAEMFDAHDAFHDYCNKCPHRSKDGTHVPDASSRRLWDRYCAAEDRARALRPQPEAVEMSEDDRHPSPRDESWVAGFNEGR
jgi:hypothetical protein